MGHLLHFEAFPLRLCSLFLAFIKQKCNRSPKRSVIFSRTLRTMPELELYNIEGHSLYLTKNECCAF